MLGVTIVAVGGLKEKYCAGACGEYLKRLGAFCSPRVAEVAEYRLGKNPGAAEIEKCLAREGKAILAVLDKLPRRTLTAALCIEGETLDSAAFARLLRDTAAASPHIAFVIGGSHGLSPEVIKRCERRLSMSAMTFPHQLARVMLLEQIYRACSINANMAYHK
jgi:23S rRNA (pseudouridine1915-N3)-methyltransferase